MNFRQRFAFGHLVGQFQVRFLERSSKTANPVAILPDIFALGFVQNVADVGASIAARLGKGNEIFDQFFEENIVFPERVVRIDHQCVASHLVRYPIKMFRGLIRNPSV